MSKRLLGGIIGCKDKISYLFGNSHLTNLHDGVSCFGSNDEARQERVVDLDAIPIVDDTGSTR